MTIKKEVVKHGSEGYSLNIVALKFISPEVSITIFEREEGSLKANWGDFSNDKDEYFNATLYSTNAGLIIEVRSSYTGYSSGGSSSSGTSTEYYLSTDSGKTWEIVPIQNVEHLPKELIARV